MNETKKINLAILGATGNVGRVFLDILEERNFPINELKLLSSARSAGSKIKFKGKEYTVEEATENSFEGIDIVLASAGGSNSKKFAPHAVKAGAVFIDNSSAFRMEKGIPLVIAGVNNNDLKNHNGIIANPNCSTSQLIPPLKALHDLAGLKRVVVSTYQSVSGAGKDAMDELTKQTKEYLEKEKYESSAENKKFGFNAIPHIDVFVEDGYTREETKVLYESRKILGLPDLRVTCTAVRIPVFIGHSESVNVELDKPVSLNDIVKALKDFKSVDMVISEKEDVYPMAVDTAGTDPVYVSRIREDKSNPNTFNMWVVADNLRIGAALNTIRIAEELVNSNLLKNKHFV